MLSAPRFVFSEGHAGHRLTIQGLGGEGAVFVDHVAVAAVLGDGHAARQYDRFFCGGKEVNAILTKRPLRMRYGRFVCLFENRENRSKLLPEPWNIRWKIFETKGKERCKKFFARPPAESSAGGRFRSVTFRVPFERPGRKNGGAGFLPPTQSDRSDARRLYPRPYCRALGKNYKFL